MDFSKFTWIRTRDGSPTLWHNQEGASFRSQKGAFTESFHVFIAPALRHMRQSQKPITDNHIVEFGLGLGTNWCLWTLAALLIKDYEFSKIPYTSIERDTESFQQGLEYWIENIQLPFNFIKTELEPEDFELKQMSLEEAALKLKKASEKLKIYPSLEKLHEEVISKKLNAASIWLHDPFGFDVNPSAYQVEQLKKVFECLQDEGMGVSYACNTPFQKALESSGLTCHTQPSGTQGLKRERLEFYKRNKPNE